MKKIRKFMAGAFILLSFPLHVFAYSSEIVVGGENVGIEINSKGVIVVGFYKVNGELNRTLKVGDIILEVNGRSINSISELTSTIDSEIENGFVDLTVSRNDRKQTVSLSIALVDGVYKTGLYVKDSMTGIGTLTYIDPETGIYGALGHEIIESATNRRIEVREGVIFKSSVTSINKSTNGSPGGKSAKFYYDVKFGTIVKNTNVGIYGKYFGNLEERELTQVVKPEDVKIGSAVIRTVLNGETQEDFEIDIIKIDMNGKIKNIYFEIIDDDLLSKTGGVVQGMSGSPILQDGAIIGAVTHVLIDSVNNGYGVFITTMLEEGEK